MTTLDIHKVSHVYVLDEVKSTGVGSTRRTILITTENGTHNLEITVYSDKPSLPITFGDKEDE